MVFRARQTRTKSRSRDGRISNRCLRPHREPTDEQGAQCRAYQRPGVLGARHRAGSACHCRATFPSRRFALKEGPARPGRLEPLEKPRPQNIRRVMARSRAVRRSDRRAAGSTGRIRPLTDGRGSEATSWVEDLRTCGRRGGAHAHSAAALIRSPCTLLCAGVSFRGPSLVSSSRSAAVGFQARHLAATPWSGLDRSHLRAGGAWWAGQKSQTAMSRDGQLKLLRASKKKKKKKKARVALVFFRSFALLPCCPGGGPKGKPSGGLWASRMGFGSRERRGTNKRTGC